MKKLMINRLVKVFALVFLVVFAISCSKGNYKLIAHKWRIPTDEVTLELHPDSTFIVIERNVPITGKWKMSNDGKSIIFREKGRSEKQLKIKELSATKLTLTDNGYDQDYVRAD